MPSPVARRAARWLRSAPFDTAFYGALRGREFQDDQEAAEDFVEHGMAMRLSPHPFLDFLSLPPEVRRAWRHGQLGQVLSQLDDESGVVRPAGPLASPHDAGDARGLMMALARRLGEESHGRVEPGPPSPDWAALAARERRPGRTSVVIVAGPVPRTVRAVGNLRRFAAGHDLEIHVMDIGSPPPAALALHAACLEPPEVEVVRLPSSVSSVAATNLGVARVTGELVVLLEPHVHVRRHWLEGVLEVMADPSVTGVQPLLLDSDDCILSAGWLAPSDEAAPTMPLVGHPKEDARRLAGEPLAALSADAMVLRAEDVVAVSGLDDRLPPERASLDLCARLHDRRAARFRLAPMALATSRESATTDVHEPEANLRLHATAPDLRERIGLRVGSRPSARLQVTPGPVTPGRSGSTSAQLRWSLQLPSPPGPGGDNWGDTYFADALADALRDLGQDVVTRRRGAHENGPRHLDDVSLALRGLYPIPPTPGQLNVLWVISHPEDVDPAEFDGYDLVCAASVAWSDDMSARTGREVVPLLQATQFRQPPVTDGAQEPEVVFVGSARGGRQRPLVWKAVEAGVPLAVYGRGWEELPSGVWRGEHVDNRDLPRLYHRYGIVLADHWPDMASRGFIANRVFDAVASGARVISDDVAGMNDVFDPRDVVVARTPQEVAEAVEALRRPPEQQPVPRPSLSFLDRARTLLDRVAGWPGQPPASGRAR